jgi:hypothetical protein
MWTRMRGWLATGSIPDEDNLEADLAGPEYGYGADQVSIQLEKKKDMRARGLPSPDDADALACTFAEMVLPNEDGRFYNPLPGSDPFGVGQLGPYDRYAELDGANRGW